MYVPQGLEANLTSKNRKNRHFQRKSVSKTRSPTLFTLYQRRQQALRQPLYQPLHHPLNYPPYQPLYQVPPNARHLILCARFFQEFHHDHTYH